MWWVAPGCYLVDFWVACLLGFGVWLVRGLLVGWMMQVWCCRVYCWLGFRGVVCVDFGWVCRSGCGWECLVDVGFSVFWIRVSGLVWCLVGCGRSAH